MSNFISFVRRTRPALDSTPSSDHTVIGSNRAARISDGRLDEAGRRIAVYVPTLAGGGAELSMLRLAKALVEAGHAVDVLLNRRVGPYVDMIPEGVHVIVLDRRPKTRARWTVLRSHPTDWAVTLRPVVLARTPMMSLRHLGSLADYLKKTRPRVIISAMFYANLLSLWARGIAGVDVRVIVTEHNTLSRRIAAGIVRPRERTRWQYLPPLIRRFYPRAEAIVAVSNGVADDMAATCGLERRGVTTIYNPVVSADIVQKAAAPCDHPWFAPDQPPVILSAGRLETQKDFATLLESLALLRKRRPARLMILGEGSRRGELEQQARRLGVGESVALIGWVNNPYAYMSRARLFALSSLWEGLGNVLIEAMACGCPVVSTDCPSGPREILSNGRYGQLTPVGNVQTLAEALDAGLDAPADVLQLRERAAEFHIAHSAQRYRQLIESVARPGPSTVRPGTPDDRRASAGI